MGKKIGKGVLMAGAVVVVGGAVAVGVGASIAANSKETEGQETADEARRV